MAPRRNYFEIFDTLAFDPVEMKDKKYEDAIDIWKYSEERRGISKEDKNGEQRQQELALYDAIKACLLDKTGRRAEAEAMKEKQKKKLDDLIAALKESSTGEKPYISNARILSLSKIFRLDSEKTVKKAFKEAGFEIIDRRAENIDDLFLSNTTAKDLKKNLLDLSTMESAKYPWIKKVKNLYDLAALYKGDEGNIGSYPEKTADELRGIMQSGASEFAGKLDLLHRCLGNLFEKGCTQVFKDEKSRLKYDNLLKAGKLQKLFSLIKDMPPEMKKDSYVADTCIKKIQTVFLDQATALALYNREAGIMNDPYEPESTDVDYICVSCNSITTVKAGTDRKNVICNVCKTPLFKICPNKKCGALIPSSADVCPQCGYNLAESKNFGRYFALAKSALDNWDFNEAKKEIELAKNAKPDDPEAKKLEGEIIAKIKELEAPLDEIDALINQKKYVTAQKKLSFICSQYPGAKVERQKKTIDSMLTKVEDMFSKIETQADKCGACYDILDLVDDYSKAAEYIKDKKPKQVRDVKAVVSLKSNQIMVNWEGSGERKVSYYLVRNENRKPQTVHDGKVLVREQSINHFTDSDITPGIGYYYGVFSCREGNCSDAVYTEKCSLYSELDESAIVKNADDGKCIMSWQLPKNCKGIRILRCENGKVSTIPEKNTKVITESAVNGYEDTDVKNGSSYEYCLQCVYNTDTGKKFSNGVIVTLRPDGKPQQATLISTTLKSEYSFQLKWNVEKADNASFLDIYDINPGQSITEGTSYNITELGRIGNKIGTIPNIASKSADVRIQQKKMYKICGVVVKGEYGIASNCLTFSNYDKVEIDKNNTVINAGNLIIRLKENFQSGLTGIRYLVASKNDESEPAPWGKVENAADMPRMALTAYKNDGMICVENPQPRDLFITVIGEYKFGNEMCFSEPAKLRVSNKTKAKIEYKIAWGLFGKKKKVKLVYDCDTSHDMPGMILCTNKVSRVPFTHNDPNNIILCKIEENAKYTPGKKVEVFIPDEMWNYTDKGHEIRLFVLDDRKAEFEMNPDVGTLIIP